MLISPDIYFKTVVVVVVTFFNHNLVNYKATLILAIKIYEIKYNISLNYIQGGPKKPGCFSDLITLWRLVLERRAVCQNFRNFIEKKVQNWHFNEFKYFLPNLLKSSQQLKLCYI